MPNIVVLGLVCAVVGFVFPRAFKVIVGAFIGGSAGIVAWSVATLGAATAPTTAHAIVHGFTLAAFIGAIAGIILVSRWR